MNEDIITYIKQHSINNCNFVYYFNNNDIYIPNQTLSACNEYLNKDTCHANASFVIYNLETKQTVKMLKGVYNYINYKDLLPVTPFMAFNLNDTIFSEEEQTKLYDIFNYFGINAKIDDNIVLWEWIDFGSFFFNFTIIRLLLKNDNYRNTVFKIREYYPEMDYLKVCILALYNIKVYKTNIWEFKTIVDHQMYKYSNPNNNPSNSPFIGADEMKYFTFTLVYPKTLQELNLKTNVNIKDVTVSKNPYIILVDLFTSFMKKVNGKIMSKHILVDENFTKKQLDKLIDFLESQKNDLNDNNRIRPRSIHIEQEQPVS
jgi:hypothetical protein